MDESTMAAIWCEIFGVPSIEPRDNFFQLGGSSFLAVRIADRVTRTSGVTLTFDAVFEHQTVESLCSHVQAVKARESSR